MNIKKRIVHYLVNDLMCNIPNRTRNPALRVLVDNKQKIEKLCMFMAHELHRKMVLDRKHSDIYEGQLLQIKLFLALIEVAQNEERPREVKKDTLKDKATAGISRFRKLINKDNLT